MNHRTQKAFSAILNSQIDEPDFGPLYPALFAVSEKNEGLNDALTSQC